MKVICIVDSISNIDSNLKLLSLHFGNSVDYVVKTEFVQFFKTYQSTITKIYTKNPYLCIKQHMMEYENEDLIIYRTSLNLNNNLLNLFLNNINKEKVVNIAPSYNFFEEIGNGVYNSYVKSLFKIKDSLASTKLQYIPNSFVKELFQTSLSNRLFELDSKNVITLHISDNTISKKFKNKKQIQQIVLYSHHLCFDHYCIIYSWFSIFKAKLFVNF